MSNDGVSPEDQVAIAEVARGIMRQLAAGQSAEDIARELCMNGWQKSTADGLVEHVQQDWRQIEAAPLANAAIYLQMKYPEMQPVRSPPTLQTVHGVGTCFYGSRDLDRATGTFVKTQCFCVLFVPVLALKSYRVASRGPGWTLMGRVPLSRFAKMWNILFLCGILAAIGLGILNDYVTGPAYVAGQKFSRAEQAAAAGKLIEAARLYAEVAHTHTEYSGKARQQCAELLERPEIDHMPLGDVTQIVDAAMQSQVVGGNSSAVISRGLAIVRSRAPTDPAASIALLGHIGRFSCAEACKTFSDLLRGPLAALPPAETIAVFRQAVTMPQSDDQKIGMVDVGIKQCQRLAATDLPATVDLLAMLAPLGDRPTVNDCLAGLLGKPLDKASCADVAKVVRGAKAFAGATGEKQLFQAGIDWVNRHPQAPRPDVLSLLDQLDELHEADRARVAAIRRPLLEKLVAENPGDVDLAVRLAVTLEAEGRQGTAGGKENPAERIVKLLLPQREKLGAGEGARVLGQALAAQGKFDESYALLGPYLDQRLTAFHEAERAFEDAIEQARGRIIAQFQNGTAPGFDFARAHAASAEQRQSMAMEYINRQIKDDPAVDAAREKLASQGMVVPAALDLGMVTLQRAQSMKDAAARRTELERAEKTFLAIRGTAGESDQYMLRLGQVYYWLGKQDEGRQEFDKLLAKHQRKAEILFSLANVLRDLGALAEARKLMEEAYAKTADEKERQGIAELRAITSTGLEDEIHWLERSNAGQDSVKALLAETRGTQAENLGKDDEAAARYREAVAIYERQPPDASVLNNGALACLRVFAITGDRQALDRGTQWLEKAVSLSPMDSVVLANAANQISQAAIQDLAGDQFNLRELQMTHDINALYYLAGDQRGLDEIRRRAREHAGLRKCLDYFNRVSVLASKNVANNLSALAIYSFLRDREALQRIARQVAAARPDTDEIDAHTIKYYQYKDEESTEERSRTRIARAEALVARLGGRDKGPAFAAAVDGLIDRKLSGKDNASVDADELVRLADDAHRAAPSMATYATLAKALMFRANKKLAADHPTYATAIRGTARALSASCVVALTLARSDDLGKAARENPDVQRAIALMAAEMEVFPESRSWLIWAVLGAAKPPRDDLRTKCLTPDELDEIQRDVGQSLAPINAHAAVETYWRRQATGAANAREPLDRLAKLGVPLPLGLIPAAGEKKQ